MTNAKARATRCAATHASVPRHGNFVSGGADERVCGSPARAQRIRHTGRSSLARSSDTGTKRRSSTRRSKNIGVLFWRIWMLGGTALRCPASSSPRVEAFPQVRDLGPWLSSGPLRVLRGQSARGVFMQAP
jgi:hypothetical protein